MSAKRRAWPWLLAILCMAATVQVSPLGSLESTARAGYIPDSPSKFYFPVFFKQYPPTLYGRVLQAGSPATGVAIRLRRYTGSAWTTQATTTTDAQGYYRFVRPPGLGAGERYVAAFNNTDNISGRLAWWVTKELTSFTGSKSLKLGDFDIAAVSLGQPAPQSGVGLPAVFRWTRRSATANDSYAFRLCDWTDTNPMYVSNPLGYADSFTLNSLPSGFSTGATYAWDVLVRGPDGGQGASQEHRAVTVMPAIYGRVTQGGSAVGGVLLELRYFNGSAWSTRATVTTTAAGDYAFASPASLSAGQLYYVRYVNNSQTAGRLFMWSTRTLNAYTTGTSVDLGTFDVADVALVNPPGGAAIALPHTFQWTRRPTAPSDAYLIDVFDPADYSPRWLSPAVGYSEAYVLARLPAGFGLSVPYAWEVIVLGPNGGSGVSRLARLVSFTTTGTMAEAGDEASASGAWPFPEALPQRPPESIESGM
jgi:hypothetical protein